MTVERGDAGAWGFLSRVDESQLVVSPTAATSLAGLRGTWMLADAHGRWAVRAYDARPLGDDTLAFSLSSLHWHPTAVTSERPKDLSSLLLACPVGALDLQVFPVVELTASSCVIEATTPLPEGHALPYVELVGDLGVLRRARARVGHVRPWWSERGSARFRMRCELEPRGPEPSTWEYDVVDEPHLVDHVLELAASLGRPVRIDGGRSTRFEEVTSDELVIEDELALGRTLTLGFELFGLLYELVVRVRAPRRLTRPLVLRRRRFRSEARASVDPSIRLHVAFRHPVDDTPQHLPVVDLSQGGIGFQSRDVLLWEGLPIREAALLHRDQRIDLGSIEIRGLSADRAHARIVDDRALHDVRFGHLVAHLRHPDLAPHDGSTFDAQVALYREAGLVMPYMARRLDLTASRAQHAWRVAHAEAPDLAFSFARYEEQEAVASVSAIQAWDRTWLAQHLAARRNRRGCSPGELFIAALDHLVLRPDCRRMVFFTTVANAKMNGIQSRFRALTGTPEALAQFPVRAWLVTPDGSDPSTSRAATDEDLVTLENAMRRDLGDLPMRALSFDAAHVLLERLGESFGHVGLRRRRDVRIVDSRDGEPRFALVTERCEPGLCIPGLVDGTWVLPLQRGATDDDRTRLTAAIQALALDDLEVQRLLLVPNDTSPPVPEAVHSFDANVYVFNRTGLRRYIAFLTHAFGELGVQPRARGSA